MLCIRPYRIHGGEFPCGSCLPCSMNKRRMWTTRIVLETYLHQHNAFITLTYADIPRGHHGPPAPYVVSLEPAHLRNFWKKLRLLLPYPIRYYGVGEYGELSGRAHFHAAVFGLRMADAASVGVAWEYGSVHVGPLTSEGAQYVAGYVCKKMNGTSSGDLKRRREFARMSNRPHGIGYGAASAIAASLIASGVVQPGDDVPAAVRINGSLMPLGQYVRRKLRKMHGLGENMPEGVRQKLVEEFLAEDSALRERRRENTYESARARIKIANSVRKL